MVSVQDITHSVTDKFSSTGFIQTIGWIVGSVIVLGIAGIWFWVTYTNKQFGKIINVFELVSGNYEHTFTDKAKVIKIGKNGFEILYLKKLKTYKLAYGGTAGKNKYYFFIAPDRIWYNCLLMGQITEDGKIPIKATSILMRASYTALEKDIDSLSAQKKTFWEQYGQWVLSISFVLIIGIMSWLIIREYAQGIGQIPTLIDRLGELVDKVNHLLVSADTNSNGGTNGGLIKAN